MDTKTPDGWPRPSRAHLVADRSDPTA